MWAQANGLRCTTVDAAPEAGRRCILLLVTVTQGLPNQLEAPTVIVGVDTHKHRHVAVAIESRGMRLGDHAFDADSEGYRALVAWAETYGAIEAFGIEGTGGYGVGLSRTVRRAGHRVVEVNRADRRLRRAAGKSDTIDAEAAARAVLAGQATATPKAANGAVEMMRQLKVTRDTAVKARTTAMIALKQILVNASPVLRAPRLAPRPQGPDAARDRGTRGDGGGDAAEHRHAPGPAAGACRKAGCHSPAQGHTRQRGDLPPRVEPVLMRELDA